MRQLNIYDLLGEVKEAAAQRLHQELENLQQELDNLPTEVDETPTTNLDEAEEYNFYTSESTYQPTQDDIVDKEDEPDISNAAIEKAIRSVIMNTLTSQHIALDSAKTLETLTGVLYTFKLILNEVERTMMKEEVLPNNVNIFLSTVDLPDTPVWANTLWQLELDAAMYNGFNHIKDASGNLFEINSRERVTGIKSKEYRLSNE